MLLKRPVFSQPLVFGPEDITFVEINILKALQQLKVATEEGSRKQMFLKYQEILKDYKSERNPLKMLKVQFLVKLQALNLQPCQQRKSTKSIFSINLSTI